MGILYFMAFLGLVVLLPLILTLTVHMGKLLLGLFRQRKLSIGKWIVVGLEGWLLFLLFPSTLYLVRFVWTLW